MTIGISEPLILERIAAISATIILFGIVSIGSLWMLRRKSQHNLRSEVAVMPPELAAQFEEVFPDRFKEAFADEHKGAFADPKDAFTEELLRTHAELVRAVREADAVSRQAKQLSNTTRELPRTVRHYLSLLSAVAKTLR